ncbi:MAG: protein kinase [Victivallales bacterium]
MERPAIPDFEIISCCGSGAYGDVWVADDRDGIRRAVKVLNKERLTNLGVLGREEKALRLFRNRVPEHPNLIRIFHSGETDSLIYYVMELADNSNPAGPDYQADTLENRLRKTGALQESETMSLVSGLADAVMCLHQNSIVHRDIKPSNILYIGGIAKLADIGLASSGDKSVSIAGTLHFIPPEKSTGFEADIYALGKVLYCAFTGFTADKFPSLPDDLNSELASRFNLIVLKACAGTPQDRFRTVAEFMDAVKDGKIRRRWPLRRISANTLRYALLPVAIAGAAAWLLSRNTSSTEPERVQLMRFADMEIQRRHPDVSLAYLDRISLKWPEWAKTHMEYFKLRDSALSMKKRMDTAGGEQVGSSIAKASALLGGNPKQALEIMEKLWEDPMSRKQARVISLYAMALAENGMFDKAVEIQKLQTELPDPEEADNGYAALADLYARKGMYSEAHQTLDALISRNPVNRAYLSRKAMLCINTGDLKTALDTYRKILAITPDDEDVRNIIRELENKTDKPVSPQ